MKNTAIILRSNVSEIMELWEKEVTKEVLAAREANAIALYDHLPNIIKDIADIMERHNEMNTIEKDNKYIEILRNSEMHGKHRATTVLYTVDQIVHEYIIFHRTLSNFLKSKNGYKENVSDLLKYVIETSILKSVGSFSLSIQETQEKLIGTLAHDIRNPLSAAQLSLEMMKEDKTCQWTEKMRGAADRSVRKAIGLIEGLMDGITVRAGEGMMLNFEEKNILKDLKWVHKEAKEVYTAEINFECEDEEINGVFDSIAIRRLLENLISNAIKYGSPAHPITITTKNVENTVIINVHNHGKPISTEKQTHIFKFLGRENKDHNFAANSWGMGLTLAQIVTKAHGGNIELTSNEKLGTSFMVTLFKDFNEPGKRRAKLIFVEEEEERVNQSV